MITSVIARTTVKDLRGTEERVQVGRRLSRVGLTSTFWRLPQRNRTNILLIQVKNFP